MRTRPTPTAAPSARPLARAAALGVALALAACSRDVTLPPEPAAPRIASVSPLAAYAGERLEIVASGLDPAPEANAVQFPSGVARGESVSGSALVVRVPDDAGSGPLTVQASGGVSAPSEPFTYRGLGRLRTGATSGEVPLLQKPYRLLAVGGDTFLHSDLLLSAVRYADPAFVADAAVSVDARPWTGEVVWLASEFNAAPTPDVSRLVRLDVATGARVEAPVAFAGWGKAVVLRGATAPDDRIAVLRPTATAVTLALHDAGSLVELQPPAELPVWDVRGCADAGSGALACLVRIGSADPLALAVVVPGPSPTVTTIALGEGDGIQEDDADLADPICAGGTPATGRVAAVALDDGRIAVAKLGAAPALWRTVDTGSRTPARALACTALFGDFSVVAPKRADDLVTAVDVENEVILWTAPVPRASRAAVDEDASTVHAAGEGDNRVAVLAAGTGALLARRSFDVVPGRAGAMQAAAWFPGGDGAPPRLVFAIAAPRGVVEVPLGVAPDAYPVYQDRPDAVGVFGPFAPYDPAYQYYFTLREQGACESGGDVWDFDDPPLATQLGQDGPGDAYVGTSGGLVTLDYSVSPPAPRLSPISAATFVSIGLLPGGAGVFAAVGDAGGWTVRGWSEARAAAGGAAEWSWSAPPASAGPIAGAAVLDGALWVFHQAGETFLATELDAALRGVRTVAMAQTFERILAVSPNGRTFVTAEPRQYTQDSSVAVWTRGAAAFERGSTVPVEGAVSGVAFDGTGEALYVLTRAPDRVVVVE